jgi:hypothetical protein
MKKAAADIRRGFCLLAMPISGDGDGATPARA